MSTSLEEAYQNEVTPEKLAETIFSKPPKEPNSCQLLLDETEDVYVFELLLKTLAAGIDVLYGDKADIANIDNKIDMLLRDYMASLGFLLNIDVVTKEEDQHKLLFTDITKDKYYCQIKLNDFPEYFIEFTKNHSGHNKYDNKYRYILNGRNHEIKRETLSEYFCVYFNKSETKKIKISFNYLN